MAKKKKLSPKTAAKKTAPKKHALKLLVENQAEAPPGLAAEAVLVPCLTEPVARSVVGNCLPGPAADDQTLGNLFPLSGARNAFRNCVKAGAVAAGMNPAPEVPGDTSTTIGDVVGALRC